MANTEGVNIVISGDSSQLVRSVQEAQKALGSMKSRKIEIAVEITKGLQESGAKIESLFGSIFKTITAGATAVAGALSMVTKNALSIGGGFESQITNVKVISGATEQELDMLIKKAREMGATLPITAKDAATAMTLLAQSGTSVKDILASVADVANLAISQGIDMGSAADLLGSTMTNFKINIDDAGKVTAIFNNASNQSRLSMAKLTEAMRYVGPAAGALKMELTEAVAGMEAVANAGLTGEMIGTGFALVLSKIASTSHIMGVRTKELDGSLRPLKDIFTELKDAGFSYADATAAFGQRGYKAALALVENSEALATNEERLKNWGSTQTAVNEKAKTFTNTMAALRSAIEEIHIEIFEQIKDQSKEAVGGLAELTREFSKWVGETQIAGKSLNAFIEGLGFKIPSGTGFKELLNQFDVQGFVNKVKNFGSAIKDIAESISSFFASIKTPLLWLIEHLETFATISFWGWILGKGLQIPAAIMGIATAFNDLYLIGKKLLALSWAKLIPLLTTPVGLISTSVVAGVGVVAYSANQLNAANEQLRKAVDEEKRYLTEQAKADITLPVDIQLDFKTGFEKLPESWTKASDKLRAEVDVTIKEMQGKFRGEVSEAVMAVMAKFPEMADSFTDAAGTIQQVSNSMLRQISDSLHGDEKAFEALPEQWRKVTEQLNAMRIAAGKGGTELFGMFNKYRQLKQEIEQPVKKDEASFFDSFNASLKSIMAELPTEIERANKFLKGSDGQLAVQLSLSQARNSLEKFVKSAKKEYSIDESIIEASVFNELKKLAQAGNATAQSLIDGWKGAGNSLDTFMAEAKDAITYLGASPAQFMPALNAMMKGIQKIDPLTGRVTEQFKKAREALKQLGSTNLDQISNRIQKMRKAFEGGFINKSALEAEIKRALPQLKLQIVQELQPTKGQYRFERDYNAVIASEFMSKVTDLFGDVGIDIVKKTFNAFNTQTGAAMGHAIVEEVERGISLGSSATFTINGIDQLQQNVSQFTQGLGSIAVLPQNISNAVSPYVAKLEQLNSTQGGQPSFTASTAVKDYSAVIASIVREIQASSQANVTAVNGVTSAVNAVENAVKSQQTENNSQGNISQALSSAIAPFVSRIEQSGAVYQSSSATMTRGMSELAGSINTLKNSADANVSAMAQLQASVKSAGDSYNSANVTSAITPLASAVNNLSTAFNAFSTIQQANSSAFNEVINAMRSVESALKSMSTGNNYDIDINQQGFMIEKKSDADMLARSTVSALRAGIGNGGI